MANQTNLSANNRGTGVSAFVIGFIASLLAGTVVYLVTRSEKTATPTPLEEVAQYAQVNEDEEGRL